MLTVLMDIKFISKNVLRLENVFLESVSWERLTQVTHPVILHSPVSKQIKPVRPELLVSAVQVLKVLRQTSGCGPERGCPLSLFVFACCTFLHVDVI